MNAEKPTIAIALSNDTAVHSLVKSGVLKDLNEHFSLTYICSDSVTLCPPNSYRVNFFNQRTALVKWTDYFLWHLTFVKLFRKNMGLKQSHKNYKITMFSKKLRFLLTVSSLPVIYEIAMLFMEKLIVSYNKGIYNCLKKINPEIVILPGGPFDPFGLDVMKCAKKLRIKSVMCVLNWDFFQARAC